MAEISQQQRQQAREALDSYREQTRGIGNGLRKHPGDPWLLTNLGYNCVELQQYEPAAKAFVNALAGDPSSYWAKVGLAECYKQLGEAAKAAEIYEALFRDGSRSSLVLDSLSQLPGAYLTADILPAVDDIRSDSGADQSVLDSQRAFIKARMLDNAGRHAEAWAQLVVANDLKQKLLERKLPETSRPSPEDFASIDQTRNVPPLERSVEEGMQYSLFILGPSRSGKTTLETLVGTLSGVQRGFENGLIQDVLQALKTAGLYNGSGLEALAPAVRPIFRELYLSELTKATSAVVFTNTRPGLIGDVLMLAEIVPNARFVFIKRDIDDVAFRIYMKDYELDKQAYSYSIAKTYAFVRRYYETIDHLVKLLPDVSRIVRYEEMVEDPRGAAEVAAELCGLSVPSGELPRPGDDRGCSEPYRPFIDAAVAGG